MYHDTGSEPDATPDRPRDRAAACWRRVLFAAITNRPDRGNETLLQPAEAAPQSRTQLAIVWLPTLYHRVPKEYEQIDRAAIRSRW
jgi:hypothetical protein